VPLILRETLSMIPISTASFSTCRHGIRSRHSLRAYAYDRCGWLRFLDACGTTMWDAARDDVTAYHCARRRSDAAQRISAASWNRAVASSIASTVG
jgi:hypothetical protein